MSGRYLMRLNSNDGTKYNLLSWSMFWLGTLFFLFFVTCGSLITPVQRIPHILACFVISGAALVIAAYAVLKLVTFHRIKLSRIRSSNDDERTADSDPAEASHARPLSTKTDPLPINGTAYDDPIIHPSSSRNPSFSPPTDSLIGLVSGESLRSRSWMYLASQAACRFRRSVSYDGSVSSSMAPYGTFHQPDSTSATDSAIANETSCSSLVEHPVYAVPNKGASRNDLSAARSRSGLVESPNCHLPLDCASSSTSQVDAKKGPTQTATRSCLKSTECYSPLSDGSYDSPPQAFSYRNLESERVSLLKDSCHSNPLYSGVLYSSSPQISSCKDRSTDHRGERPGLVKDSGLSNPLYGASYERSPQISTCKDRSEDQQGERPGLVKDSGLSNPLYGASCASSPQISIKDPPKNRQPKLSGLVKDSGHNNPLHRALYPSHMQTFSSKNKSQDQQGELSGLGKEIFQSFIIPNHSNPLDGAPYAKSSRLSSKKDQFQNRQDPRSSHVEDSGHTNPLYSSSCASSMQTLSTKNQSKNEQVERSGLVKELFHSVIVPGHSNPLDGASVAKSSKMSSSKDPSQDQQGARPSLVQDPRHCNLSNEASCAKEGNSYHGELTDQSPECYQLTNSSSSDRTTVIENPFAWPTQSSEGRSENAVDSSMKEPAKHYKKLKGKKANSLNKIHHRKLKKPPNKKPFLKGMRVRTVTKPQVYVGMCTYGPREELKVIYAHRFPSYSSEVSSPDDEGYTGPTRV